MLVVAALGGHALTTPDRLEAAAATLATIARDHELIVTHGNGPQAGDLARGGAALDDVDAESQGLIGARIERALRARLGGAGAREVATLVTHVVVDPSDPAFATPTKPIGPREGGRLVASPRPLAVVERRAVELLVGAGHVVVCAGGGGIPVVTHADGALEPVEAVIDKDRTSSLLARALGAGELLLLTDVDGVYTGWGEPGARRLRRASPAALRRGSFAAGSMGPKVEAAGDFVDATGGVAVIAATDDGLAASRGEAGTVVTPDAPGLEYWG